MKGNKAFVNEFDIDVATLTSMGKNQQVTTSSQLPIGDLTMCIHGLLSEDELNMINDQIDREVWIPVGKDGILSHYHEDDEIGSWRLSTFEESLAYSLWKRMKPHFPPVRQLNEFSQTDWDDSPNWEPFGINPLFRFIRYTKNGVLIPHYDAPFIQSDEVRSLSSLVMYLSDNPTSGGTRFLKDLQASLPISERNHDDWTHEATDDDVDFKIYPSSGDAIIFDHRMLHDSERINHDETKTIIRTDILYRRVK